MACFNVVWSALRCTALLAAALSLSSCATRHPVSASVLNAAQHEVVALPEDASPPNPAPERAWRADVGTLGQHSTVYLRTGMALRIHGSTLVDRMSLDRPNDRTMLPLPFEYTWFVPRVDEAQKVDADFIAFLLARAQPGPANCDPRMTERKPAGKATAAQIQCALDDLYKKPASDNADLIARAIETMSVTTRGVHLSKELSGEKNAQSENVRIPTFPSGEEVKEVLSKPAQARDKKAVAAALVVELPPWGDEKYLNADCSLDLLRNDDGNSGAQEVRFRLKNSNGTESIVVSIFEPWTSAGSKPREGYRKSAAPTDLLSKESLVPWTRLQLMIPVFVNDSLEPILVPSCLTVRGFERRHRVTVKSIDRDVRFARCPTKARAITGSEAETVTGIFWQCKELGTALDEIKPKGAATEAVPGGRINVALGEPGRFDSTSGLAVPAQRESLIWLAPNDRLRVQRATP